MLEREVPRGSRGRVVVAVVVLGFVGLVVGLAACGQAMGAEEKPIWTPREIGLIQSLGPVPSTPPASATNRYADETAAAELGHDLFFEKRLSGNGEVSCAKCHEPDKAFTDGKAVGEGIQVLPRNTPTVLGSAWSSYLTWDGRKDSLWSQALGPIEGVKEMGSNRLSALRVVRDDYRDRFEAAYGPFPEAVSQVLDRTEPGHEVEAYAALGEADRTAVDDAFVLVGKSFAAYERHLTPGEAPFDRFRAALLAGDQTGGGFLSPAAIRGLRAFLGPAGCINCHNGPLFTDQGFHNLGLPERDPKDPDLGRSAGVTKLLADPFRSNGTHSDDPDDPRLRFIDPGYADAIGSFRTPSLRNVAETAPYGHSGQFKSLDDLLGFYREHQSLASVGHLDPLLQQVRPNFTVADMKAFLESLTGNPPPDRWRLE